MKIAVVGSGAREDAIAWAILNTSDKNHNISLIPGNGGSILRGNSVPITDINEQIKYIIKEQFDMVIIGPEVPLVEGMSETLQTQGIPSFGPGKQGSMLEGSKLFSKDIMMSAGVKTASYSEFKSSDAAIDYLQKQSLPIVIKADGLASGKGVKIIQDIEEGTNFIKQVLDEGLYNSNSIIIEEYLEGEEVSILCFVDDDTILPIASARDYKRAYDNDEGLNTGGMGSFSPSNIINETLKKQVVTDIFRPVVNELYNRDIRYNGILYGGLMLTEKGIYVLEFNCRFGDPETQSIVRRLNSDIVELFDKTINNKLHNATIEWDTKKSLGVVMASKGYPIKYEKGHLIKNIELVNNIEDIEIFFAGVKHENNKFYTSGGRVITVTGTGNDLKGCRGKVYDAVKKIECDNLFYRNDIGG